MATRRPTTSLARPGSALRQGRPASQSGRTPGDGRPTTSARPMPGGGRLMTAQARTGTAMRGPGTARPGTRVGTAQMGQRQLNLSQRPVTQQGLQGVRPMTRGGQRMVLDKSYYMGVLRTKMSELSSELTRLNKRIDQNTRESQNMAVYEKKAEELAQEIEDLRGELADHNLLVDKMNTGTDTNEIEMEWKQIKEQNDIEGASVDELFSERRLKEDELKALEAELETEKRQSEDLMNNIDPEVHEKYNEMVALNDRLAEELRLKQQELEDLVSKKTDMEADLAANPLKREAMVLYEKLGEAEAKRDGLLAEVEAAGTPEQERERLLQKIKQDNQEIATMERQMVECKEKVEETRQEIEELEQEFEDQQSDKNQKYKECKLKEQQMDDFFEAFDKNKAQELTRINGLEKKIVHILTSISKVTHQKIDSNESETVNLDELSPRSLEREHRRMVEEFERVSEIELKLAEELQSIKERSSEMNADIQKYENLDELKQASENKQEIVSLEKKLQHCEQSNFSLREAIETKRAETDVGPMRQNIMGVLQEYHQLLSQSYSGGRANSAMVQPY